jgi:hypothetical protein
LALKFHASSSSFINSTAEPHVSGIIGAASHPDLQKIRIFGFFFEIRLLWQFEVQLLTIYGIYLRLILLTTPDLKS